jgi:hypothetical protein
VPSSPSAGVSGGRVWGRGGRGPSPTGCRAPGSPSSVRGGGGGGGGAGSWRRAVPLGHTDSRTCRLADGRRDRAGTERLGCSQSGSRA